MPDDTGWTGAEIRQCCELAWRLQCTLLEAADYVVPVSRSAASQIEELRGQAHGRFLSRLLPGLFDKDRATGKWRRSHVYLDIDTRCAHAEARAPATLLLTRRRDPSAPM